MAAALGWSTILGGLIALVMALRISGSVSVPLGCIAAWGPTAALVGLIASSARLLWPPPPMVLALVAAVLATFGPLGAFGWKLASATHLRPLGAATFAVFGVGALLAMMAVFARLAEKSRERGRGGLPAKLAFCALLASGALVAAGFLLVGLTGAGEALGRSAVDVALVIGASGIAGGAPRWKWSDHPRLSVGLWITILCVSTAVLIFAQTTRAVLFQSTPVVLLPLAGWLGG